MAIKFFKNRKRMVILFIFIFLGAFYQVRFSRIHISEVPLLLTTMRAKEFCSCYFMLEKGKDYCLESIKKGYPLFNYTIDEVNKRVIFKNPMAEATAEVVEGRYGCSIK